VIVATLNVNSCLETWIAAAVSSEAMAWLHAACQDAATGPLRQWITTFALVPRRLGKEPLAVDLATAEAARPGWQPQGLRVDQAARLRLLLACQSGDVFDRCEQIAATADSNELETLYRGLPLYPQPERYRARAAEGCRSNIRALFCAVAHRNPFPAEQFDDGAWNQMVLKALFIETALAPISGLDTRRNLALATMLTDYAAERRAASRPVAVELWRCVAPYANERALAILHDLLRTGTEPERVAAALALHEAIGDVPGDPEREAAISGGTLNWDQLAPEEQT
jgi:hypothetical protein